MTCLIIEQQQKQQTVNCLLTKLLASLDCIQTRAASKPKNNIYTPS